MTRFAGYESLYNADDGRTGKSKEGAWFKDLGWQLIHAVDVFTREVLGKGSSTKRSAFAHTHSADFSHFLPCPPCFSCFVTLS